MGEAKKITDATTVILSIFTPGHLLTKTQNNIINAQKNWNISKDSPVNIPYNFMIYLDIFRYIYVCNVQNWNLVVFVIFKFHHRKACLVMLYNYISNNLTVLKEKYNPNTKKYKTNHLLYDLLQLIGELICKITPSISYRLLTHCLTTASISFIHSGI